MISTRMMLASVPVALGLALGCAGGSALAGGTLRIAMTASDVPITTGAPDNGYEGVRLGGGLRTNAKLSRFFSVGGYGAYGFKDRMAKYGGDLRVKPMAARSLEVFGAWD